MAKIKEISTRSFLYPTSSANLPEGGQRVGCYVRNIGELTEREFPKIPVDEQGKPVFPWPMVRQLINALIKDYKDTIGECTGKRPFFKKPTGWLSVLPALLTLARIEFFD